MEFNRFQGTATDLKKLQQNAKEFKEFKRIQNQDVNLTAVLMV